MIEQPTDSSDWLDTNAPYLSNFESTLRCHICKEFFKAPMITQCDHTFCSYCIRTYLSSNGKSTCPVCRQEIRISALKKNIAMEEMTEQYTNIREKLMDLTKRTESTSPPPVINRNVSTADYDLDSLVETSSSINTTPEVNSDLRRSSRNRKTPDNPDFVTAEEAARVESEVLGECPICFKKMKVCEIQGSHITKCLNGQSDARLKRPFSATDSTTKSSRSPLRSSSSTFSKPSTTQFKKLPTLHYSSMNDSKLREALSKLGLSRKGTRQELERRHVDFLNLWNANCDSKSPLRRSEIMDQLQALEKTHEERSSKLQAKQKDFDNGAWSQENSPQFADLITQARNSIKKRKTDQTTTTS